MKKITVCIALAGLLALGGQAFAAIGTMDNVPAATLLLPYFEVDVDNPDGTTTLFSINNASSAPMIAHVTLWTDYSIPTIDFNVWLTGYDVYTMNLRDIFTTGFLPATGPTVSNIGAFSDATNPNHVGSCGDLPLGDLPQDLVQFINLAHTGQTTNFGGCYSTASENPRGYITVDVVNTCTRDFPNDPDYYNAGVIGHDNALWGNYFYVDPANNFAQGDSLVHVESDPQTVCATTACYSFYDRYSGGVDGREALSSTFAARYLQNDEFDGGTNLTVWRDSGINQTALPSCPAAPGWFPLSQDQIVVFDEEENPNVQDNPFSGPRREGINPFPLETQRVQVGSSAFPSPFQSGWLYLNLNDTVSGGTNTDQGVMQNWVATFMEAEGRFSVGFDAIQLDNVTFLPAESCTLGDGGAGVGTVSCTPVGVTN